MMRAMRVVVFPVPAPAPGSDWNMWAKKKGDQQESSGVRGLDGGWVAGVGLGGLNGRPRREREGWRERRKGGEGGGRNSRLFCLHYFFIH